MRRALQAEKQILADAQLLVNAGHPDPKVGWNLFVIVIDSLFLMNTSHHPHHLFLPCVSRLGDAPAGQGRAGVSSQHCRDAAAPRLVLSVVF